MDYKLLTARILVLILGIFLGKTIPRMVNFFTRGKCETKGPARAYTLINTMLYTGIICLQEFGIRSMLYCIVVTMLLVLAVIDWKICEIPNRLIAALMVAAVVQTVADWPDIREHLTGFVLMGIPLTILFYLTKGKSLGGGDVKLMAVIGLLMGWEDALMALLVGCILALGWHVVRRKKRVLAFGPYLSAGIILIMLGS